MSGESVAGGRTPQRVLVRVSGVEVEALLDTGANVSLVNERVVAKMTGVQVEEMRGTGVNALNGGTLEVTAAVTADLLFGSGEAPMRQRLFVVRGMPYDLLLGTDFHTEHQPEVRWGARTVHFPALKEPVTFSVDARPLRVRLTREVRVPARSEVNAAAVVETDGEWEGDGVVWHHPGMIGVANCVVTVRRGGVVPVRLLNVFDCDVIYPKDEEVGVFEAGVEEDQTPVERAPATMEEMVAMPASDAALALAALTTPAEPAAQAAALDEVVAADAEFGELAKMFKIGALTDEQRRALMRCVYEYRRMFVRKGDPLPSLDVETRHHIDTGGTPPIALRMRRMGPREHEEVDRQVAQFQQMGLVRPSTSAWSAPPVMAIKKDGSWRFCVDYRRLNDVTVTEVYPIPRIDDTLDFMAGVTWFAVFDAAQGYHQVEVAEEDVPKTAFTTRGGTFEWIRMPMGLKNAPVTFQRLMDSLLAGLKWSICMVYIDDIIVIGKSFGEFLSNLTAVLSRLAAARVSLRADKTRLALTEVVFLGHVVGRDGVRPDPEKLRAVREYPVPQTAVAMMSFLGLCGWYRRFVRGYVEYEVLLRPYTRPEREPIVLDEAAMRAFVALKEALCGDPVLAYPDFTQPFLLQTDASDVGVAAILSQRVDRRERVVSYAARALNARERRFTVSEKECLALLWAIRHFRAYLVFTEFLVITDHAALVWLRTFSAANQRLERWSIELSSYNFKVLHRAGTQHRNVDALTRIFEPPRRVVKPIRLGGIPAAESLAAEYERLASDLVEPVGIAMVGTRATTQSAIQKRLREMGVQQMTVDVPAVAEPVEVDAADHRAESAFPERMGEQGGVASPKPAPASLFVDEDDEMVVQLTARPARTSLPEPFPEGAPSMDLEDWRRAHQEDVWVRGMLKACEVSDGVVGDFFVREGLLYRRARRVDDVRFGEEYHQLVVPRGKRLELMRAMHDSPYAGHLGVEKTYERVVERYWWHYVRRDVRDYIRNCVGCQARKAVVKPRVPFLHLPVRGPFDIVGMDILSLPETPRGNRYVIVFTDYFTKWVEAAALTRQTAREIARVFLTEVVARHGTPYRILSDRGANFMSDLMKAVARGLGIAKMATASYHPQANGQVERFNKVICDILSHYVSQGKTDWDVFLPFALYAYRSAVHAVTKMSPYFAMYGRVPRSPSDVELWVEPEEGPVSEYVRQIRRYLRKSLVMIKERLAVSHEQQRKMLTKHNRKYQQFEIGQKVFVWTPAAYRTTDKSDAGKKKLARLWTGPYKVVRRLNNVTYEIEPAAADVPAHHKKVPVEHMTPYRELRWEQEDVSDRGIGEVELYQANAATMVLDPPVGYCEVGFPPNEREEEFHEDAGAELWRREAATNWTWQACAPQVHDVINERGGKWWESGFEPEDGCEDDS